MDTVTKTIKKMLQRAAPSLSQDEKRTTRDMLADTIDLQPVSSAQAKRLEHMNSSAGERTVWSLFIAYLRPMPTIAVVLALALTGGVSAAAQQSLPGETLYPIKVSVNEEVADWFSVSAEADARRSAMLAERRLEEAEQLAVRGELEAQTRAQTSEALAVHLERFDSEVAKLEAQSDADAAAEARARLESGLTAHDRVLAALESRDSEAGELRANVRVAIQKSAHGGGGVATLMTTESAGVEEDTRASASADRDDGAAESAGSDGDTQAQVAAETGTRASAEGKITAAEKVVASAQMVLEKVTHLSAEARAEMKTQIEAAEETVVRARAELEAKAYTEASRLAESALRRANEARVYLSASERLEIDLGGASIQLNTNTRSNTQRSNDNGRQVDGKKETNNAEAGEYEQGDSEEADTTEPDVPGGVEAEAEGSVEVEEESDDLDVEIDAGARVNGAAGMSL